MSDGRPPRAFRRFARSACPTSTTWSSLPGRPAAAPGCSSTMTAAPRVIDTFKNLDFIFNNPYRFEDRFNDDDGYFHEAERLAGRGEWKTNFIADVWSFVGAQRASAEEVAERARAGLTTVRGSVGAEGGGRQVAFVNGTVRCG